MTTTPLADEVGFEAPGKLLTLIMAAAPSKSDGLRNDFAWPLARMLGSKNLVPQAIGNSYLLATDLFEAGDDSRNATPLYSQAERMLNPIMPRPKLNLVMPFVRQPNDRMITFPDRAKLMTNLRGAAVGSNAYTEYFPGAMANRIAGQTLPVGKFIRAYLAATAELRDQPLFPDETADHDGKRDIAYLFAADGIGRKVIGSMMDFRLTVRVLKCLAEKVPQPEAVAAV